MFKRHFMEVYYHMSTISAMTQYYIELLQDTLTQVRIRVKEYVKRSFEHHGRFLNSLTYRAP